MPTSLHREVALRPPGTDILATIDLLNSFEKYCMCPFALCPRFFPRGYPLGSHPYHLDATTTLTQRVRCPARIIRVRNRSLWSRNWLWRNPHLRQRPTTLQPIHPPNIKTIGLVGAGQHHLRSIRLRGTIPASSVSPTIQYQLPTVSIASGEPDNDVIRERVCVI